MKTAATLDSTALIVLGVIPIIPVMGFDFDTLLGK